MLAFRRLATRLAWLVPFVALVYAACDHNPAEPGALATITVTRNPDTLAISTSRQFTAVGLDANGNVVGINPTWSVAAGGGAINASGVFVAGTVPGTFANTVTATVGSISGRGSVTVLVGPAASITVTPATQNMATSATQQFTAVVRDAASNVLAITPSWAVTAGGGTISTTGLFTAGTVAGTYTNTVRAAVGNISASATVTVTLGTLATITVTPNLQLLAINGTQQFTAVGRDVNNNVVAITPTWSVAASGGTINSSGVFTAGTLAGVFANTVKACSANPCVAGTVSGFASVTVNPGVLAAITVTPNPVAVGTDASLLFTAVGRDASGNIIPIVPAPVFTVDAGGAGGTFVPGSRAYTAPSLVGVGFDTVRATSGSIFGQARANVTASGGLVSISVTPNPATVVAGGTAQFVATGFDATGLIVPTGVITWSVVPAVGGGTINSGTGLFTAGAVDGTFTNAVKATSTMSGYASVIVNPLPPPGPSLGTAETHGILAGSAVTCASPPGTINADVSVWSGSSITGFGAGLCTITGAIHAGDAVAQAAQGDLTTAYLALQGMTCGNTISADLGGTTLPEGVYCSGSTIGVTGTLTLTGNANSLFVFQAGSSLTTAGDVVMIGGAQAKNVYWVTGASATLGVNSDWQGNILSQASITLEGTATLCGRALARIGAVDLNGANNTIKLPPVAAATCTFP